MRVLSSEFDIDLFQFGEIHSDEFTALFCIIKYKSIMKTLGIAFSHTNVHVFIPALSIFESQLSLLLTHFH